MTSFETTTRRDEQMHHFPIISLGIMRVLNLFQHKRFTGDVYTSGRSTSTGITWNEQHQSHSFVRIPRLSNIVFKIVQISAGADHVLCLTSSYSVLAVGSNTCKQLGINDPEVLDSVEPVVVDMPNAGSMLPVQVCCGAASSYCLTADGSVIGWGLNECGQIGSGYVGNGLESGLRKDTRRQHIPTLSPFFGPDRSQLSTTKKIHPISAMIKKLLYSAKGGTHEPHSCGGRPYGILLVAGDRHVRLISTTTKFS